MQNCSLLEGSERRRCRWIKVRDSSAKLGIFFGIMIGLFFILVGLDWASASIGSWYNMPWISGVDPNLLAWYHWFDVDGTPYSYAMYHYMPELWWSVTYIVNGILAPILTIGGAIVIANN